MCKRLIFALLVTSALQLSWAQAADVTAPGDTVQGVPNDGDWPGAETPPLAFDDVVSTKFLHFKGETQPTGIRITLSRGPSIVTGLTFTTANDAAERDPIAWELSGSTVGIDGPYTLIAKGDIVDFKAATVWLRLTKGTTPINFNNAVAYQHYQLMFTAVRAPASANSMQIAEIELLGIQLTAYNPNPADGSQIGTAWASLSWTAGQTAASHDVYFGDDRNAVAAGTGGTFRGNQTGLWFIVGFTGYPYPEGLQTGKTYYWRIDEVEAGGTTKHAGNVWSFSLPPLTAYNPQPADGMKFVDPNIVLGWTPGWGAKLHYVYFGTDYATVDNAGGALPSGSTTYDPGPPLNLNSTYYWRVDEYDGFKTTKGTVWSFTTAKVGGGLRGEYYNSGGGPTPANPFQTLLLVRIDPQINFSWGETSPDPLVPVDGFAARWIGDIEIPVTDTYTFYTSTDDGARLWVNGQRIINQWREQGTTEWSGSIQLAAGVYPIEMHYYENGGGAVATLSWSSSKIAKALIPQAAMSPPVKASGPRPDNGAVDVRRDVTLRWQPGQNAVTHEIYFGTSATAVANATKASSEYKGSKPVGSEEYVPGILQLNQTYYWKVDEVNTTNPDSPWKGNVWSFTVGNFLTIDDMEDYNNFPPDRIFETWIDGWGNQAVNGAIVGHPEPDFDAGEGFAETTIIHGGLQSMPYYYNCNFKYSEAVMTLKSSVRNWTQEGVKSLTLWFRGYPAIQGSLTEAPAGTFTMTAAGADIWNAADEFHYAYKMLNGPGTITAKVSAIANLQPGATLIDWAKAGVMIRETLDPNSPNVYMCLANTQGISGQYRATAAGACANQQVSTVTQRPLWLKLDRAFDGTFTASYANDVAGAPDKWTALNTVNVQMAANVYIGLALTSHQAYVQAKATFSGITLAGTITGATWTNQDIGIRSNQAERMFVAIQGTTGPQAIVYNTDPQAATRNTWTEWNIPLSAFTGINLSNVDTISIGFGTKGNTSPGGSGLMYFDDIRLYKGRCFPLLVRPDADFSNNCVVDMADLDILANNWLIKNWQVTPSNPDTAGGPSNRYPLDGSATDVVGGRNGTLNGGPTWVTGKIGQAVSLDGVGAYIAVDANATRLGIGGGAAKTVTAWAYTRRFNNAGIFDMGANVNGQNYSLRTMTTPNLWRAQRYGYPTYDFNFEYPSLNAWVHFALAYDGAGHSWAYADGQLVGSQTATLNTADTRPFEIGRWNTTNFFDGMIDEVRIYKRGLTQAEVAYLAGKTAAFDQAVGLLVNPQDPKMDLSPDGQINFKDFAVLIDSWLEEKLWP